MTGAAVPIIVLLDSSVDPHVVEDALPASPFRIAAHAIGLEQGRQVAETVSHAVVVGCAGPSEVAEELVATAVGARPGRPVIVLCEEEHNGFLQRLFEAGADDVLVLPEQPDQVAFALEKAIARREGSSERGTLVAVIGPKGGTGKTVVSTNVAVALARTGHRAILVDADLQFGDVALSLGIEPRVTLADLARSGGTLDAEKVNGFLLEHPTGLRVLAAPLRPDEAAAVRTDLLTQVYALLRELGDVVIVDSGPGFPPEVIATIDAADQVCLVGTLDAASLKDSRLGLETLALMGHDTSRCRIVLNRADTRVGISGGDVERVLGRIPDARVPSDRDVPRSVNVGEPIVVTSPRSSVSKALTALAAQFNGSVPPGRDQKQANHLITGRA